MLKIKNLYKNYKDFKCLKDVSFEILKGETKALIGVNGSGKSTLIECVCGVKNADSGTISVNNIANDDKRQTKVYKQSIGYVSQSFGLFNDLTVKENLEYMCAVYGIDFKKADEIMKLCELEFCAKKLAGNLSGGYRQLLSFACAIVHKPKLIILDEPTSAMDPIFRKKFWQIIRTTKSWGSTILIVTHYLEELLECDKFVCLNDGKITYDGNVQDFKKDGFIDIEQILSKYSEGEA